MTAEYEAYNEVADKVADDLRALFADIKTLEKSARKLNYKNTSDSDLDDAGVTASIFKIDMGKCVAKLEDIEYMIELSRS